MASHDFYSYAARITTDITCHMGAESGGSYKAKKARAMLKNAGSSHNWNMLFMRADTVAEAAAARHSLTKGTFTTHIILLLHGTAHITACISARWWCALTRTHALPHERRAAGSRERVVDGRAAGPRRNARY
jgi:hypothetical protein